MILMAATRSPVGVIIFSWTAGVMYSTLFTMPYLLVANYHASQVVGDVNISVSLGFTQLDVSESRETPRPKGLTMATRFPTGLT